MKITGQKVTARGRLLLNDLAERGFIWRDSLRSSDKTTMTSLAEHRGLAGFTKGRYVMTHEGYAFLIAMAAEDLAHLRPDSTAAGLVRIRIAQLVQLATISGADGIAVNWKGDPV